ncbi:MAG: dehydrogenase, partial [Bacteroidales bacterium]|nr:dehydrogenase [Bacteroidales bacterium]
MPKCQFLDPQELRKQQNIEFNPIPVNSYNKTLADERNNFSEDELLKIYKDMILIREFETMLNLIKTTGGYNGVDYNHPGPAHLSIGQEAAAVGMARELDINDYIFGS